MNQGYVSPELTHFAGRALSCDDERFRLLLKILRDGWLQASHRERLDPGFTMLADRSKNLTDDESLITPTLCFCDIPQESMGIHTKKYSSFGIAFPKLLLLRKGASPVFYVASTASSPYAAQRNDWRKQGQRFDALSMELEEACTAVEKCVWEREPGSPIPGQHMTFKHSPEDASPGQQALGKLRAVQSELDELLFSRLKFFTPELPFEHPENYYMEREWRILGGLAFAPEDVAALYVPRAYSESLRKLQPGYQHKIRILDPAE